MPLAKLILYITDKKYTEKLKTVCNSMGLMFSSNKPPAPEGELRKFNLFLPGIHPLFKTVMKGKRNPFYVTIFNYGGSSMPK